MQHSPRVSRRSLIALGAMGGLAALAGPAVSTTVTDASGSPVAATAAKRIVSIGNDVTETIFALGEGHRIVAADTTSTYPPAVAALPNVGYMRALSTEGVLSLSPDLIVASQGAGPHETIAALRQSGIPLALISDDPSTAAVGQKIKLIGSLLQVDSKANALAETVAGQFATLAHSVAAITRRPRVLFILSLSGGRIIAAGSPSAASAIIDLAGAQNAFAEFNGFKPVSEEAVLSAQPEAILLMKNPRAAPADDLLARQPFSATPAAKDKRLMLVDGSLLLSFGPRAPQAARDLAIALHPGLPLPPLGG